MTAHRFTTVLSTKGQVILPSLMRARLKWEAGTRLVVEETAEGVLLRPAAVFEATQPDDVFGCLAWHGDAKSIEDMDAGVLAEARRRHAGD